VDSFEGSTESFVTGRVDPWRSDHHAVKKCRAHHPVTWCHIPEEERPQPPGSIKCKAVQ